MAQRFASLAVALALAFGAAAAQAQSNPPPPPPRIGVVDLAVVFKQYKRSAELEDKINAERDRLRGDLEAQKKNIAELLKQLDPLTPDSETYQVKEDEKDAAVARFDRTKKRLEESLKKRWEDYNFQLLDDIEKVVKAYGEDNHFTLILKIDGKPSEEQRLLAGLKTVLYASKELDITAPIVEILNRNFDLNKGGPAGTPAQDKGQKPAVQPIPTPPPAGQQPGGTKSASGEKK